MSYTRHTDEKNEESTDDIKKLIIVPLGCGTEQRKI